MGYITETGLSRFFAGLKNRFVMSGPQALTDVQKAQTLANLGAPDVETGTWTPTFRGSTTQGTYAYTKREGRYVRVGNLVLLTLDVQIASVTTAGTGNATITGLPFSTSGNGLGAVTYAAGSFQEVSGFGLTGSALYLSTYWVNGANIKYAYPNVAILSPSAGSRVKGGVVYHF